MSHPSEPEFTQLRRLLALKRHEAPPPGYFDFLAGQIQLSLRSSVPPAPQVSGGLLRRWMQKLETWQTRPAFAVGVGAVFCVLVVGAVVWVEQARPGQPAEAPLLTEIAVDPMRAERMGAPVAVDGGLLLASNSPTAGESTLFDLIQPPTVERAGVNR